MGFEFDLLNRPGVSPRIRRRRICAQGVCLTTIEHSHSAIGACQEVSMVTSPVIGFGFLHSTYDIKFVTWFLQLQINFSIIKKKIAAIN
jgi:hypothetical protein